MQFFRSLFRLVLLCSITLPVYGQTVPYTALYDNSTFPRTIDLDKPVGTTAGTVGTTPSGAATYTIPIQCPPGTGGMVPQLSVVYNSQGGNGLLGQGWNLSGLSAIGRAGKDFYHDETVSPVAYTNADAFVLDGQRLVTVSGANGASGTTYVTELESYSTTTSYGTLAGGPDYFRVVSKDGTIMEFGNSATSKFYSDDNSKVMLWRLNKIQDVNGNYIEFTYGYDRNAYIYEIKYTGNTAAGLLPYNTITFGFFPREDRNKLYDQGYSVPQDYLLSFINVEAGGDLMKEYEFEYAKGCGISYLKRIKEASGDATVLNDTRFQYGMADGFSSVGSNINMPYPSSVPGNKYPDIMAGDFDGDGKSEILLNRFEFTAYGSETYTYSRVYKDFSIYKQTASGSSSDTYVPLSGASDSWTSDEMYLVANKEGRASPNFMVSDFDGDGQDDILFMRGTPIGTGSSSPGLSFNGTTIYYSRKTPTGFSFEKINYSAASLSLAGAGWPHVMMHKNNMILGDFDGDKRTDYLYLSFKGETIGGTYYKTYNTFICFPAKGEMNQYVSYPTFDDQTITQKIMDNEAYIIDLEGDGTSEIMYCEGSKTYIYRFKKTSGGAYHFERVCELNYPNSSHPIKAIGDFNGDGKTDLVTSNSGLWKIALGTGKGFHEVTFQFTPSYMFQEHCESNASPADRLFVGDFNGDGKSDLLHESCMCGTPFFSSSNYVVYYFKGYGWDNIMQYDKEVYVYSKKAKNRMFSLSYANNSVNPIVTDVNGDGKQEICFRAEGGDTYMQTIYLNKDSKANLLEKVNDGFNRTTTFTYELLTKGTGSGSGDFYTRGSGATYPLNNGQYPVYVLTGMQNPNGVGGQHTTQYKYENLRLHRAGRGLLGFEKLKTIDLSNDVRTETIFELNTTYYTPFVRTEKTFTHSTNYLLSETHHSFEFTPLGGPAYRHKTAQTSSLTWDFLKGLTTTVDFDYDAYGNVTNTSTTITGGPETFTSSEEVSYVAAVSGIAIPNKPSQTVKTIQRGTQPSVSTRTNYTYDSRGRVISTVHYPDKAVAPSPLYYQLQEYGYDFYGNMTQKTEKAHSGSVPSTHWPTTLYEYDTKGRFPVKETNPLGHFTTSTWHPFWGKPLSITGVNGLTGTFAYDAWGKKTGEYVPTAVGTGYTITYSHAWALSGSSPQQLYTTLVSDPSAPDVRTYYDILGREIRSETESSGSAWTTRLTSYDARGNVAGSTNDYLSTETPLTTTNTYDGLNRLSSSVNAFGTTSYSYAWPSGQHEVTITLPDGKIRKTLTDALGKVTKSSNGIAGTVHYRYDSRGNEISTAVGTEAMPVHNLTRKEYNAAGQLQKLIDADAGTTTYNYNPFGQLRWQEDPKGKKTFFQYDVVGRLVQKILDDYTTTYTYYGPDKDYRLQQETVVSTAEGTITDHYDYAVGGGMIQHARSVNGVPMGKQYTYDVYNRLLTTDYANSGFKTKNYYDANGFLEEIRTNFTPVPGLEKLLYKANSRNGMGQILNYRRVDGTTGTIAYHHGIPLHYLTPGIQNLSMSYNYANGNVMSRTDHISNTSETFTYDAIDRLTRSQAQKTGVMIHVALDMTYDNQFWGSFGRLTSKTDVGSYTYGGFPRNAVKSVTDPATLISHETQDISYTPFHKTGTITETIGAIPYEQHFVYDVRGNRVYSEQRQSGSPVRERWYMGDFETDQDPVSGETSHLHYINGDNGLCAIVVQDAATGAYTYYGAYTDHLGSIVALTDETATVIARQSYDPWGGERNPDTWGYTMGPGTKPSWLYRGYTGHEILPEYGLINMNGRMYDPLNGRMLRPDNFVQDPANSQSYNRYSYCWNNPLKYTDPSGNIVWAPVIIGAVVGAYMGGTMANNGNFNPTQWDYNSGKTWGYMAGGAIVGGISGGIGGAISTSGVPMANTLGIAASSFTNSLGTAIYTGGQTDVSVSFGIASYNFSTGSFGYLGKKGNSALANIGYGFGALANLQDIVAGFHGTVNETRAEHGDGILHARSRGEYVDATGTAQNYDISVAHPPMPSGTYKYDLSPGDPGYSALIENLDYARYWGFNDYAGSYYAPTAAGWKATIHNVNSKAMGSMYGNIKGGLSLGGGSALKYGYPWGGCYGQVARALFRAGVPTVPFYGFTPHGLVMQLWLRQAGIYASPYLINK